MAKGPAFARALTPGWHPSCLWLFMSQMPFQASRPSGVRASQPNPPTRPDLPRPPPEPETPVEPRPGKDPQPVEPYPKYEDEPPPKPIAKTF